jgi:alkyl hydroperoxide reductase subunit F
MSDEMYDLAIVGGGPAGTAAAIYAARKLLKTVFITQEWGGQSAVASEIQNWVGIPKISGVDLADNLRKHVETYKGDALTILSPVRATSLTVHDDHVEIALSKGGPISARTLLVATGADRRKLDIPGAKEYDQKGLTYCASCDGPLFADKDVAIIGGGNAGFETALQLLAYCKTVTLLNRSDRFKADEITVKAALAHPNMRALMGATPTAIEGAQFVTGLKWKNAAGEESVLPVEGIFVEVGLMPNTTWLGNALAMNEVGQIKVDAKSHRTSHPRVWAAGDVTDGTYHQNNIAAGDAVKALEDVYLFLRKNKSEI